MDIYVCIYICICICIYIITKLYGNVCCINYLTTSVLFLSGPYDLYNTVYSLSCFHGDIVMIFNLI